MIWELNCHLVPLGKNSGGPVGKSLWWPLGSSHCAAGENGSKWDCTVITVGQFLLAVGLRDSFLIQFSQVWACGGKRWASICARL